MGNFKNRLAAIQTTSLVALLPIEDPGPPQCHEWLLGVVVAVVLRGVPSTYPAYPAVVIAYPVSFLAYPATAIAYPVVVLGFGLARSKGSDKYGVPYSRSAYPVAFLAYPAVVQLFCPAQSVAYPVAVLAYPAAA